MQGMPARNREGRRPPRRGRADLSRKNARQCFGRLRRYRATKTMSRQTALDATEAQRIDDFIKRLDCAIEDIDRQKSVLSVGTAPGRLCFASIKTGRSCDDVVAVE